MESIQYFSSFLLLVSRGRVERSRRFYERCDWAITIVSFRLCPHIHERGWSAFREAETIALFVKYRLFIEPLETRVLCLS
jgi:hypothetical protein